MSKTNKNSDKKAKNEYIKNLQARGFTAEAHKSPVDIIATKDGQTWYFEIKMTKRASCYFGGATLTEWNQAIADPNHFRFVVAKTDEDEKEFEFFEFTPDEFMAYSTIPPFKIFFNINLNGKAYRSRKTAGGKAVRLTHDNLTTISKCYDSIKERPR